MNIQLFYDDSKMGDKLRKIINQKEIIERSFLNKPAANPKKSIIYKETHNFSDLCRYFSFIYPKFRSLCIQ